MSHEYLRDRMDDIDRQFSQLQVTIESLREFAVMPKQKKHITRVNRKLAALYKEDIDGLKKTLLCMANAFGPPL